MDFSHSKRNQTLSHGETRITPEPQILISEHFLYWLQSLDVTESQKHRLVEVGRGLCLCQCSITHTAKNFFMKFKQNLLCSSLSPLPLVLAVGMTSSDMKCSEEGEEDGEGPRGEDV